MHVHSRDNRDIRRTLMHQSIPPAPSAPPPPRATAGHLPTLSVPGVGHVALPRGRAFANPRANPELLNARGLRSEYNYKEGFTGRKADWLICQGQE